MATRKDKSYQLLSKHAFANELFERIRLWEKNRPIEYEPAKFRFITGDHVFTLGKLYDRYRVESIERREALLDEFVRSWLHCYAEVPIDFEKAGANIIPVLWKRCHAEIQNLGAQHNYKSFRSLPFALVGDNLAFSLAYDIGPIYITVHESHRANWNVTAEQAQQVAINNLRDSGDEAFELVAPGLLQARDQDPAQLLLTDVIRRQKVNGDHIAMVPDGVSLFLTGSEDAEGLANMANFAERLTKGRLSLSGIPLRLNGDVWVAFLPSHLHASYRQFERLRAETVVQDYSDQQLPLQAMLDPKSKRVFVSPLSFLPLAKKQSSLTCCDWVSGINVLLPKADLIRFVLSENKADHTIAAITEWDHAVNIVGNLMVPQGLYPERYRVSSFPTAAQMAKLKSASKYSS